MRRVWLVVALALLVVGWLQPSRAHAAGVGDLLPNININEATLHDPNPVRRFNSCGVAAAAMLIDYYQLDYRLPTTAQPASIDDVASYVPIHVGKNGDAVGTYPDEVKTGLVAAEAALHPSLPLTAAWRQANSTNWLTTLQAELDHGLPVILFIADGSNLGWTFKFGHFIVVSGYTDTGDIVYHDPWDGKTHPFAQQSDAKQFLKAWSTPLPASNPDTTWTYQYLEVLPPNTLSPVASSSGGTPAPTARPTLHGAIHEFHVGSPGAIAIDAHGNIWFANSPANGSADLEELAPNGTILNTIPLPNGAYVSGILAGPDGNMWFTSFVDSGDGPPIVQVQKATPHGEVTSVVSSKQCQCAFDGVFPFPGTQTLTFDKNGDLWFIDFWGGKIDEFTVDSVFSEFANDLDTAITTGPDGNIWFMEEGFLSDNGPQIGRITPEGVTLPAIPVPAPAVIPDATPGAPEGIVTGPDGNLWFTDSDQIGQITPSGSIHMFSVPTPHSDLENLTLAPDGNIWFTEGASNLGQLGDQNPPPPGGDQIGQITPDGLVKEFTPPTANSDPYGITSGPNNTVWFTEVAAGNIGIVS